MISLAAACLGDWTFAAVRSVWQIRPSGRSAALSMLLVLAVGCTGDSPVTKSAAESAARPATESTAKAAKESATKATTPAAETPQAKFATGGPPSAKPQNPLPEPVFRPDDSRPKYDDRRLAQQGILRYESSRLVLYSDIAADAARAIPPLVDQLYDALEVYFGPLPPDRQGSKYQLTGFLMSDRGLFRDTGLLPDDLPSFLHGRHRGREFWLDDQPTDYYRRHLIFHEATHCFMTTMPHRLADHLWYMEGMAELFGTHVVDAQGKARFGIFPHAREAFPGLGRIRLIEEERRAQPPREAPLQDPKPPAVAPALRSLAAVSGLIGADYTKNSAYAWSWALCRFLDGHPRYRERFRARSRQVSGRGDMEPPARLFAADLADLSEEWLLFAAHVCHGYDIERAAIEFNAGKPLADSKEAQATIRAQAGWQSTGLLVEQGRRYRIRAKGRALLAQQPRPWESEPQGISIRYHDGRPLGLLLAAIRSEPAVSPGATPANSISAASSTTMLDTIAIGKETHFAPLHTGTLYLRINDFWNELSDNEGEYLVEMTAGFNPSDSSR
jgi:hypothetical protein